LQLQSLEYFHPAFVHEHLELQPLSLLHPRLTSSLHTSAAIGIVLQTRIQVFSSSVHPQSSGVGVLLNLLRGAPYASLVGYIFML